MNSRRHPNTLPQDQFVTDVLPPYDDFLADPTQLHRAKAALDAAAHFAEHVFVYFQHHEKSVLASSKRAEDFVSHLAETEQCEELNIVWDIALAGKHRILDRPARRERFITSSTAALPAGAEDPLKINLEDGRQLLVADVLKAAIEFWRRWLQSL